MSFPLCFNSLAEHQEWQRLARRTTKQIDWPCVDCTLEYQQRMVDAGRCQHPDILVGKTKTRKPKSCPVPSAVAKPEVFSGKTLNQGQANRQRSVVSVPDGAKSFTKKSSKRKPKGSIEARSIP
jgi:hypothetical protein